MVSPTYSPFTKFLHWLTFVALTAQFTLGYALDVGGHGRGRGRGRGGGPGRGRGRGGDGTLEVFGDDTLLTAHVVLGLTILVLAVVRLWWRTRTTLPPWAPTLSRAEQTVSHWNERLLYLLLFVIPSTGLWLVLVDEDALAIHVTSHVVFFAAFAVHVGVVLKHQLFDRDRLLNRML